MLATMYITDWQQPFRRRLGWFYQSIPCTPGCSCEWASFSLRFLGTRHHHDHPQPPAACSSLPLLLFFFSRACVHSCVIWIFFLRTFLCAYIFDVFAVIWAFVVSLCRPASTNYFRFVLYRICMIYRIVYFSRLLCLVRLDNVNIGGSSKPCLEHSKQRCLHIPPYSYTHMYFFVHIFNISCIPLVVYLLCMIRYQVWCIWSVVFVESGCVDGLPSTTVWALLAATAVMGGNKENRKQLSYTSNIRKTALLILRPLLLSAAAAACFCLMWFVVGRSISRLV